MSTCIECGTELQSSKKKKYCSKQCNNIHTAKMNPYISQTSKYGISTGAAGTIGEIIVAVHLTRLGYFVFRGLSPECPCDLLALKDNKIIRIEVRTGQTFASGTIHWPTKESDYARNDFFAIVDNDDKIYFVPTSEKKRGLSASEKYQYQWEIAFKTKA